VLISEAHVCAMSERLVIKSYTKELTLCEPVNRGVLTFLIGNPTLVDSLDNSPDRKYLYTNIVNYAQRVMMNDTVTCVYAQKDYHACRVYVEGNSLQNFPRTIRGPLAHGKLFDTDIKSCHPTICQFLTQVHQLESTVLTDYVNNREDRLRELQERSGDDRDTCKELMLSVLNGGLLRNEEDDYLCRYKKEVIQFTEKLLEIYPEYTTIKEDGTDRTPFSLLMQDIENWCIQITLPLLKDYKPAVLCYDGIMTQLQVPQSVMQACCDVIGKTIRVGDIGLRIEFAEKEVLKHDWGDLTKFERHAAEAVKRVYSSYAQVKEQFELTSFKLRKPASIARVTPPKSDDTDSSDVLMLYSPFKLKESTMNLFSYKIVHIPARPKMTDEDEQGNKIKHKRSRKPVPEPMIDGDKMIKGVTLVKSKLFADQWLSDEDIRTYDRVDFRPRPLRCAPNIFNLWSGYAVEREGPATDYDIQLMHQWVLPFIKDIICGGIDKSNIYLINYLAQMFQSPGVKPNTSCVLLGAEGLGKNRLSFLLMLMTGMSMYLQSAVIKDVVLGRFACPYENRIMLVLDEVSPEEMRVYQKPLMDIITSPLGKCEKKGVSSVYMVTNCLRIFWTTNDGSRWAKLPPKDRKYAFFECSDAKVGQIKEYFAPLMAAFDKPGVRRAFYDHLMSIDVSSFNFQTERCEVQMYKDSKLLTVRREMHFLRHHIMKSELIPRARSAGKEKPPRSIHVRTSDLFKDFSDWVISPAAGIGKCASFSSNLISFGIWLKDVPGFCKDLRHGCAASHTLDATKLVQHLQECDLLTQLEVQWLLTDEEGLTYNAFCTKLEQQALEEAKAKMIADEMAFKKEQEVSSVSYHAEGPLKYAEDAFVHNLVKANKRDTKQEGEQQSKKAKI
jgi:hypothetical protein